MLRLTAEKLRLIPSAVRANYPVSNWIGSNRLKVKVEKERFIAVCSCCRQNLKFGYFTLFCGPRQKCSETLAARAARLFFLLNQSHSCFSSSLLKFPNHCNRTG